jgi:hypothetical protein
MRKAVIGVSLLISFLLLAQFAGVVVAEDEENGETHEGADDFTLCLSAIFLLLVMLIIIGLIVLGFSRRGGKA